MTNHLPGSNDENFDCGNRRIEWRLTTTWGDDSPLCVFFFVWMGICSPYLIALPHFSGAVPRRYQHSSIYMEIKAFAEVEYNLGGGGV